MTTAVTMANLSGKVAIITGIVFMIMVFVLGIFYQRTCRQRISENPKRNNFPFSVFCLFTRNSSPPCVLAALVTRRHGRSLGNMIKIVMVVIFIIICHKLIDPELFLLTLPHA